mmetsp:Transcript_52601/g.105358  ORF Transcript_52601/g.105358 Transcript_52601/m.105358 type:complete len:132 (-) Transcript_52601:149-544(-)
MRNFELFLKLGDRVLQAVASDQFLVKRVSQRLQIVLCARQRCPQLRCLRLGRCQSGLLQSALAPAFGQFLAGKFDLRLQPFNPFLFTLSDRSQILSQLVHFTAERGVMRRPLVDPFFPGIVHAFTKRHIRA